MITKIFNFQFSIFNFINNRTPILYLTQSLWRDEAFSVLLAEKNPLEIIKLTAQDFNPPFYYLLLYFWMKIFGQSEISVRMLSFLFHILLVYVGYHFAKKIFKSKFLLFVICYLLFVNPMLLYYAFEARMYSLLTLLATLSMYYFHQKNWKMYIIFTTLGLYTQSFMIFIPLAQLAYSLFTSGLVVRTIKLLITPFIFYLPWILVISTQLTQSAQSWIHSADLNLVTSSLGRLFLGFDGKPPRLWIFTKILSLVILLFSLKAIDFNLREGRPHLKKIKTPAFLFFLWIFIPLSLVLLISFFKPIYVNRYLIFVTVGEIFLITSGIQRIANKISRKVFVICFLLFVFFFNLWYAPFHQKKNFRKTMTEINRLMTPDDIIIAKSPLSFFEANYYAKDRSLCYLLNKEEKSLPPYLGKVLIPQDKMIAEFPEYPKKAFLVYRDGSFEVVYKRIL